MSIRLNGQKIAGLYKTSTGTNTLVDDVTIEKSDSDVITTVGVKSKSGDILYDWMGTNAEYEAGIADGSINEDWVCWITDDDETQLLATREVGETIFSLLPLKNAGYHLLDGSTIHGDGIYKEFVDYMATLVPRYPKLFASAGDYQASITNYGVCGKFVYDSTSGTVRLPKITGITEGTLDTNALGDLVQAGAPNITGSIEWSDSAGGLDVFRGGDGCLARGTISADIGSIDRNSIAVSPDSYNGNASIIFNAANSNPIYGNSNTIQPQTIKGFMYIVISNAYKTNVQVNLDDVATDITRIETKADNSLNKNQVSNCILKIPQRIKYDLTDGKLTIQAGTVFTVPYGTIDLSADYPVGSTFLHANFRVVDTQFTDGKFFVWAELLSDLIYNEVIPDTPRTLQLFCGVDTNNLYRRGALPASGTSVPSDFNSVYYNIDTNYCRNYTSGTANNFSAFPIMIVTNNTEATNNIASVDQVFNGMGFIGEYTWVDKGVSVLFADGRNEDGTLKNLECTSTKIVVMSQTNQTSALGQIRMHDGTLALFGYGVTNYFEQETKPINFGQHAIWYNLGENQVYSTSDSGQTWKKMYNVIIPLLQKMSSTASITSIKVPYTFKAVDTQNAVHAGMPSSIRYVDLTLGASGAPYTAPADGYFAVKILAKNSGNWAWGQVSRHGNVLCTMADRIVASTPGEIKLWFIAPRYSTLSLSYNTSDGATLFRFYYAEGER